MRIFFFLLMPCIFQVLGVKSAIGNINTHFEDDNFVISDFKTMITTKGYMYIDKTLFIKEVMDCEDGTVLITRPPGFGKSLALSTLYHFLSNQHNDLDELFFRLDIMKRRPELNRIRKFHMGKHPVINLDFSNVAGSTFEESYVAIQGMLSTEFSRHAYVLDGNASLTDVFNSILNKTADKTKTADSINWLSRCIDAHYNNTKRVVVLIDGYDTPVYTSYFKKYYEQMVEFMGSFLHRAINKNRHVVKTVMTGVAPVAGEILPGNVVAYTVFDNMFSQFFGLLPKEVDEIMKKVALARKKGLLHKIQCVFNGYSFGNQMVYHPRAMVQFLYKKEFGGIFTRKSQYILEHMLFGYGLFPVLTLQKLMGLMVVRGTISKYLNFPYLSNHEEVYWTCLTHFGYVTASHVADDGSGRLIVTLRIPNLETVKEIETTRRKGSRLFPLKIPDYEQFLDDMKNKNFAAIRSTLDTYLQNAGTYFKLPEEEYDGDRILGYVLKITLVAKIPRNATSPIIRDKENITVTVGKTTTIGIYWHRMKNVVCPLVRKVDKNRTEIRIWYNKRSVATCLQEKQI